MDPASVLSTAAAAQQFAAAAGKVVVYCYGYAQKYRHANTKVNELAQELRALACIFDEVRDIIHHHPNDLRSLERIRSLIDAANIEVLQILAELPQGKLSRLQRMIWPFTEEKTVALVDSFAQKLTTVNICIELEDFKISKETLAYVSALQSSVAALSVKFDKTIEDEKRSKILKWISFNRFSSLRFRERHEDRRSMRHPTAGISTMSEALYRDWKSQHFYGDESWLWAIGKAGSRKSTIMSVLIDDITASHLDAETEIAVLYCQYEFTDRVVEQSLVHILGSLTAQLLRRRHQLPHQLVSAYEDQADSGEVSSDLVFEIFLSTIRLHGGVYLVVDGLDELNESVRVDLLGIFDRLHQERVKFLVSSRAHPSELNSRADSTNTMTISPTQVEIAAYLRDEIASNERLQVKIGGDQETADLLVNGISSAAGHSFTFAVAMLGTVQAGISKGQVRKLMETSKTPNEVFDATMRRILQRPQRESAITILGWLAYARAPLKLEQLQVALAVTEETGFDEDFMPGRETILEICEGLIQVQPSSDTVSLTHLTVRDFLVAQPQLKMARVEENLARTCIQYLMSPMFATICTTKDELRARQENNCFATYAASYWYIHAKAAHESELEELILTFAYQHYASSALQLLPLEASESFPGAASPFVYRLNLPQQRVPASYLLAQFELWRTQRELVELRPECVGAAVSWGYRYSPLHLAVWLQDEKTARIMVQQKVNFGHQDQYGITPIHLAASLSIHFDPLTHPVLGLILQADLDKHILDLRDHDGSTALHSAALVGAVATVKALLQKGYDPNARDFKGLTPLHQFLRSADSVNDSGRESVLNDMLMYGADPSLEDNNNESSLSIAVSKEWPKQIAQLREARDPHTGQQYKFSDQDIALSYPYYHGPIDEQIVRKVQRKGPNSAELIDQQQEKALERLLRKNLKAPTREYLKQNVRPMPFNALSYAARKGGCDTITLLIAGKGDINAADSTGRTPLHFAAEMGREQTIWTLISAGADPDVRDQQGRRPIDLLPDHGNGMTRIANALTIVGKLRSEARSRFPDVEEQQHWLADQLHEVVKEDRYLNASLRELHHKPGPQDPVKYILAEFAKKSIM